MENASPTPIRYAGFWRRLTAYGIDSTIVQILVFVLIWLVGSVANAQDTDAMNTLVQMGWLPKPEAGQTITDVLAASGASGNAGIGMDDLLIIIMVSGIYNIWFTASALQATPGKRWCGLKVIMATGQPIGLFTSAVRWFASGISWLPLGFGYLMVGFSHQKTAMHDAICGTRVIYR